MRKLTGFWDKFVKVLSVALILFQMYTIGVRQFSDIIQRSVHLAFVLTLVFILKPMRKGKCLDHVPWYDILFAVLSAACCIYVTMIYSTIVYQPLQWVSSVDKLFAVVLVVLNFGSQPPQRRLDLPHFGHCVFDLRLFRRDFPRNVEASELFLQQDFPEPLP